jgi:hypothetical protein
MKRGDVRHMLHVGNEEGGRSFFTFRGYRGDVAQGGRFASTSAALGSHISGIMRGEVSSSKSATHHWSPHTSHVLVLKNGFPRFQDSTKKGVVQPWASPMWLFAFTGFQVKSFARRSCGARKNHVDV